MLQSRDGVLRFFPWLSADFERASFHRLRALGGYVVSANYRCASRTAASLGAYEQEPAVLYHSTKISAHILIHACANILTTWFLCCLVVAARWRAALCHQSC
eukprot:COSAG05_NODE_1441_length_4880_cov_3.567245_3_plen_102_part_00